MRQGPALLLLMLLAALVGCVNRPQVHQTNWLDRVLRPAGPVGADAVQMDVALIERPLGDTYLIQGLWVGADEQVVALEQRAALEDNGLRIGQIGGIVPVDLQNMLTSERSCANPRRIRTAAGKPTRLTLGPELAECSFQLPMAGKPQAVKLNKALCTLEVVPTLTTDGRIKLKFLPQVLHGDSQQLPRPTADMTGWMLKEERPTERYTQLGWEVTLAPGEYVLIGGRYDKPESLGHQCFLRRDEANGVQRLLVIRTARAVKDAGSPSIAAPFEESTPPRVPPLASQATLATARGSGP